MEISNRDALIWKFTDNLITNCIPILILILMLMFKGYTSMLDDVFLVMHDAHSYSTRDVFIKMKHGY